MTGCSDILKWLEPQRRTSLQAFHVARPLLPVLSADLSPTTAATVRAGTTSHPQRPACCRARGSCRSREPISRHLASQAADPARAVTQYRRRMVQVRGGRIASSKKARTLAVDPRRLSNFCNEIGRKRSSPRPRSGQAREQMCEAHFDIGERHLMQKAITEAETFLIWPESFCVTSGPRPSRASTDRQ